MAVNDPWVGTAHQPDVNLLCPVFVEGKLFCWVVNAAHMNDVGGTVPGSFCPNAKDIFFDPPCFPPCRMVRDGKIDAELEWIYRRQSRTPINLALDLRAAVAGNHASRERVLGLIAKYGAATVKGVMKGLLDSNQESFKALLAKIPDGKWSERLYQEVAVTGDRGVYPVALQMHKGGESSPSPTRAPPAGRRDQPDFRRLARRHHARVQRGRDPRAHGGRRRRREAAELRSPARHDVVPRLRRRGPPGGDVHDLIGVSMVATVFARILICSHDEFCALRR